MATLRDIKARLKTVGNIRKITRAMQLVAAAKLNKAQERAHTVRPYADELNGILGALAAGAAESSDDGMMELSFVDGANPLRTTRDHLFGTREMKKPGLVLITSDRGLCGAFNTNLIRAAQAFLTEHADKDCRLITLGRKGSLFYRRRDVNVIYKREGISDHLVLDEIKDITAKLVEFYVTGEVDALYLVYAKSLRGASYRITTQKFLSVVPGEHASGDQNVDSFILEPNRDQLFAALIPLYATTTIFSAFADSFASEYGAKMAAMQLATKNADERINDLIIERNRQRQATITKELAEIVGGAEALN